MAVRQGLCSALKNHLEAAIDQAFAVEGHCLSRLHARVGHHLLGPFVTHGARRPDDPRKHDGFVLFAFDCHGERRDLAFGDIIAPTLDHFQCAVFLDYGRRLLSEFHVSFTVGLGHWDHKTINVGHGFSPCVRLPAILMLRLFQSGLMFVLRHAMRAECHARCSQLIITVRMGAPHSFCRCDFIIPPPTRRFFRYQATQRNVVTSRAAEVAGFPALRTVPEACARPAAASLSATPALIPTNATAIAPAIATATILKWVARSALSKEWVISVSPCASEAYPKDEPMTGFPTAKSKFFSYVRYQG